MSIKKNKFTPIGEGAKLFNLDYYILLNGDIYVHHSYDGGNVGLHKHLSTSTITKGESGLPYINLLRQLGVKFLEECSYDYLSKTTKVFIDGAWIGVTRTDRTKKDT